MSDPGNRPLARRTFLKVAAGLGVTAGCSPRAATQKVIPFLVPPEEMVPGTPLYYRTACRECPALQPAVLTRSPFRKVRGLQLAGCLILIDGSSQPPQFARHLTGNTEPERQVISRLRRQVIRILDETLKVIVPILGGSANSLQQTLPLCYTLVLQRIQFTVPTP